MKKKYHVHFTVIHTNSRQNTLLECTVFEENSDEYHTADSLNTSLDTIPGVCIAPFIGEGEFVYIVWIVRYPKQFLAWTTTTDAIRELN